MRITWSFVLLIAAATEIQPSFHLESSAWRATDIIVATEGDKVDGKLTVLEPLKGGLKKGDTVQVSDLARFAAAEARAIHGDRGPGEGPTHVTGSRMILFMVRAQDGTWEPATSWKVWSAATLWIEGKEVFGFDQPNNPGPSLLVQLQLEEGAVREHAVRTSRIAADLTRAAKIADLDKRAAILKDHLTPGNRYAFIDVVKALEECGAVAAPILAERIRDDSLWLQQGDLVISLARVLGDKAGPELHRLFNEDLAYWRLEAPRLKKGWLGFPREDETRVARLCRRMGRTIESLRGLRALKYAAARETAVALRDLWRSTPALEDSNGGIDTTSKECDAFLESIR
jgi:hypothetical protein